MTILKTIFNTILDALFPRTTSELESLSYSPEQAWQKLPHAPRPPLPRTDSIFAYKDEKVAKLVWNIKYKKSAKAIAIGGYALRLRLVELIKKHVTSIFQNFVIIPIPITKRRKNERGYNQCELLVNEIERLDIDKKFIICKDLLGRVHHLSRQTLKNREDRLESAKGIFTVNEETRKRIMNEDNQIGNELEIINSENNIDNTIIIVIDDVITTGSTMKEAMETLQNAGFKNVFGLSLAH